MAALLWGNVYYADTYCGVLREETGNRYTFQYDSSYAGPPIAHLMPVRPVPYTTEYGLHPFFDNLLAEGWLAAAQTRLLGKRDARPIELLLAFGHDCAGAVSIIDPSPRPLSNALLDPTDAKSFAAYRSRASLSGIQPKLPLIDDNGILRVVMGNEVSTHIAKFPSESHPDIIENEYLSTLAYGILLPREPLVQPTIQELPDLGKALIIPRFDRKEGKRIHFEEFTSLLGMPSEQKYDADHSDIARFIIHTPQCTPTDLYRMLRRILAGFLIGNTDMHLKNHAMLHKGGSLSLTPCYDQVCGILYEYPDLALTLDGYRRRLSDLKARNIELLAQQFGLHTGLVDLVASLGRRMPRAVSAIHRAPHGDIHLKTKLIRNMEARWNGTFSSIGKASSRKPSRPARANT